MTAKSGAWQLRAPTNHFQAPAHQDLVIYETHVRDLTADDSSPVATELKGTYAGVLASKAFDETAVNCTVVSSF